MTTQATKGDAKSLAQLYSSYVKDRSETVPYVNVRVSLSDDKRVLTVEIDGHEVETFTKTSLEELNDRCKNQWDKSDPFFDEEEYQGTLKYWDHIASMMIY